MGSLRKIGKKIATVVANSIQQNNLFEQPGERPMQEPLQSRKQRESETKRVRVANLDDLAD